MSKLIFYVLSSLILFTSFPIYAETSVCDGQWRKGQPVHVVVDWNSGVVIVNSVKTRIVSTFGEGIITSRYVNKFGHTAAFVISNSKYYATNINTGKFLYNSSNTMTFISHVDINMNAITSSYGLHCSKSFIKPFMNRMINETLSNDDLIEKQHKKITG